MDTNFIVIDRRTATIVGNSILSRDVAEIICDRCERLDADGSYLDPTFIVCAVRLPEEYLPPYNLTKEEQKPQECPDGLLPDGEKCPRCGGRRGPSGIDGGTWVHY